MEFEKIEKEVRKRKEDHLEARTAKEIDDKARIAQTALEQYEKAVQAYEEQKMKARSSLKTQESYDRMCARRLQAEPVPSWPFLMWINRWVNGRETDKGDENSLDPIFCPSCDSILTFREDQEEDWPRFCPKCGTKIKYQEKGENNEET